MADKKLVDMNEEEKLALLKECQLALVERIKVLAGHIESSRLEVNRKSDFIDEADFSKMPDYGMHHYRTLRQLMEDKALEETALELAMKAHACETYPEYIEFARDLVSTLADISGVIATEEYVEMAKEKRVSYACGFMDGRLATYKHFKKKYL